jgi:hypothetical protein
MKIKKEQSNQMCVNTDSVLELQCSDSAFNQTVHKSDATAKIVATNSCIAEKSPALAYFQLFLLPDMMNTIAKEITSQGHQSQLLLISKRGKMQIMGKCMYFFAIIMLMVHMK